MIIPDGLSLTGTLFALAISFGAAEATGVNWQHASVGALVGGGTILFVAITYRIIRGRDGMGMGDVKLMALLGAYLGFAAVPFILFTASIQGTLFAAIWWMTSRSKRENRVEPEANDEEALDYDQAFAEPTQDGKKMFEMSTAGIGVVTVGLMVAILSFD